MPSFVQTHLSPVRMNVYKARLGATLFSPLTFWRVTYRVKILLVRWTASDAWYHRAVFGRRKYIIVRPTVSLHQLCATFVSLSKRHTTLRHHLTWRD